MSLLQKLLVTLLPRKWAERMEAASRSWIARCPCGFERSFWDAGGIRWKAGGKEKVYLSCPHCGQSHWHTIYRKLATDEAKAAPRRPA
jgi:hypothetical protein